MDTPAPGRSLLYRQLRAAVVLLLIFGTVGGIGLGVYRVTLLHPKLDGEREFTFDPVELVKDAVTVNHTFVLTNHQRRPVTIEQLTTSCGCTAAEPSTKTIAPGASVEIATSLRLDHEGVKKSHVTISYGGVDLDTLYLQATCRLKTRLQALGGPAPAPGQPMERFVLFRNYDTNDQPPAPELVAPPGVRAEFAEWTLGEPVRHSTGTPARWKGRLVIHLPQDGTVPEQPLVVKVGDHTAEMSLAASAGPPQPIDAPPARPEDH